MLLRASHGRWVLLTPLLALTLAATSSSGLLQADEPSLPTPPPPADSGLEPMSPTGPTEAGPMLAPPPEADTAPLPPIETPPPLAPVQPKAPPTAEKAPEPAPTPSAAAQPAEAAPKIAEPEAKPSDLPLATATPTPTPASPPAAAQQSPPHEPESAAEALLPTETEHADTPAPAPSTEPGPSYSDNESFRHHGQVPEYQKTRPQWSVELTVSPSALGTNELTPDFTGNPLAYEVNFEFQPAFFQSLGVLGFGPVIGLYSFPADQGIAASTGVWTVGGEVRYQARYFREQLIVPVVGYAIERIQYHFQAGAGNAGVVEGDGPILGLYVLLNSFEPSEAEQMFKENGVSRSYFIAEARDLTGDDGYLSFSGFSYFFGLRIEF